MSAVSPSFALLPSAGFIPKTKYRNATFAEKMDQESTGLYHRLCG